MGSKKNVDMSATETTVKIVEAVEPGTEVEKKPKTEVEPKTEAGEKAKDTLKDEK